MGMWQRFKLIFASKANKALDRAEDPRETLDYSYEKQLELLQKVRRGVADVATSRKRIELQIQNLAQQTAKLTDQAKAALAGGREDLAREALTRKSGLETQIADLHAQMQIVSAHLEEKEFVALGKLTIADCALAPILGRCLNFPYDRPEMPGLEAWFKGISSRPAFKTATG